LNLAFFHPRPAPPGEVGGGMANAIQGGLHPVPRQHSGVPIGNRCSIYLAEYGRNKFGNVIRFTAEVLNGRTINCDRIVPTA